MVCHYRSLCVNIIFMPGKDRPNTFCSPPLRGFEQYLGSLRWPLSTAIRHRGSHCPGAGNKGRNTTEGAGVPDIN